MTDLFLLKKIADKILLYFPDAKFSIRIMSSYIKITGKEDYINEIINSKILTKAEKEYLIYDVSDITEIRDSDIIELI